MELVIGPYAYSTWSLRPWLVLKRAGLPFTTQVITLHAPDAPQQLARHSPSGFVPVLKVGDDTIWDSLGIALWCAERVKGLWPEDPTARALAYSVTCEMHSGFMGLRTACSMGVDHPMVGSARSQAQETPALEKDLRRLVEIWKTMRTRFASRGPWLFGTWSIADAFFTPVATRVRHYGLRLDTHGDDGQGRAYVETLLSQPDFLEWEAASEQAGS